MALWSNQFQKAEKEFNLFRILVFAYLIAILLQALASSRTNPLEFAYLSKIFAAVLMICLFCILEAVRFCIQRHRSNQILDIGYMFFTFVTISVLTHEASVQENQHQQQGLLVGEYPFMILKPFLLILIPSNLMGCIAFLIDTAYLFAREPEFHSVEVIAPALITFVVSVLLLIQGREAKNQALTIENLPSRKVTKENDEWMKEVLSNLQDGIAVFNIDGTLKYSNPGLLTILEAKEEQLIDCLTQLPNKDINSHKLETPIALSPRNHIQSITPKISSNQLSDSISNQGANQQFSPTKKSTFHEVNQNDRLLLARRKKTRSLSMCDPVSNRSIPMNQSPRSPRLDPQKKGNLKGYSPENTQKSTLLSNISKFATIKTISPKTSDKTQKNPATIKIGGKKEKKFVHLLLSKGSSNKIDFQSGQPSEVNSYTKIEKTMDDQALKYHPFGETVRARLLRGIKYCHCGTVGEAMNMMFSASSAAREGNNQESSALGLITAAKFSFKTDPRNSSRGRSSQLLHHYTEEEQEIAESMYMSSFIRGSGGETNQIKTLEIIFNLIQTSESIDTKLLVVTVRDSTSREMAQRLKHMVDRKSEALAIVSHEFRAPLNGIMSMLELLSEKVNPTYEQKYIRPALVNSKRLLSLANNVLDYHQIQNNKLKLVHASCCLKDMIQNVIKILEIPANMRGLELDYRIDKNVPFEVVTDSSRLEQILLNLTSNALKFTEAGSIHISIVAPRQGKIKFQVKDTGIGIKESNLSRLFTTFGRVELGSKSSLNPNGVGLGLVISNALSKSLNSDEEEGGLKVESVYGKGSCFSFTIDDCAYTEEENFYFTNEGLQLSLRFGGGTESRIQDTPNNTRGSPGDSRLREIPSFVNSARSFASAQKQFGTKLHTQDPYTRYLMRLKSTDREDDIQLKGVTTNNLQSDHSPFAECSNCMSFLAIDDDDFNIYAIKNLLLSLGFMNFDYSTNGLEALKKIKGKANKDCHNRYKIIFLDCEMPIINGYDTAQEIRRLESQKLIPAQIIIGVTGNADSEKLEACLQAGMNDTIVKPLMKQNLYEKINKWLPQELQS